MYGIKYHSFKKALNIQVSEALKTALIKLCQAQDILIRDEKSCGPACTVTFDHRFDFIIDEHPILLTDCTLSDLLAESLSMMSEEKFRLHEAVQCFNLSGTQIAFEVAQSHALSTILVHFSNDQPLKQLTTAYPEYVLFRDDGWYILAGDLGG